MQGEMVNASKVGEFLDTQRLGCTCSNISPTWHVDCFTRTLGWFVDNPLMEGGLMLYDEGVQLSGASRNGV